MIKLKNIVENIYVKIAIVVLLITAMIGMYFFVHNRNCVFLDLYWEEDISNIKKDYVLSQSEFIKEFQKNIIFVDNPLLNISVYSLETDNILFYDTSLYGQKPDDIWLFFDNDKLIRIVFVFSKTGVNDDKKIYNIIYNQLKKEQYKLRFEGSTADVNKKAAEEFLDPIKEPDPVLDEDGNVIFKEEISVWENENAKARITALFAYKDMTFFVLGER